MVHSLIAARELYLLSVAVTNEVDGTGRSSSRTLPLSERFQDSTALMTVIIDARSSVERVGKYFQGYMEARARACVCVCVCICVCGWIFIENIYLTHRNSAELTIDRMNNWPYRQKIERTMNRCASNTQVRLG